MSFGQLTASRRNVATLILAASASAAVAGSAPQVSRGEFKPGLSVPGIEALRSWDVPNVGSGFWNVNTNWAPNVVPGGGDDVRLYQNDASDRIVTYVSPTPLSLNSLRTDASGNGLMTMQQSADQLSTNEFVQGVFNGKGRYDLSGGTLATQLHYVGAIGSGTFNMTGGRLTNGQFVAIGNNAGSTGRMTVSGGIFNGSELEVGYFGTGSMTHTGGLVTLSQTYGVGWTNTGVGTFLMGNTATLTAPSGYVGLFGSGTFIQAAGTHTIIPFINSTLSLGEAPGAKGYYHMFGGTLSTPELSVGSDGVGTFLGTGGTVNAGTIFFGARTSAVGTGTLTGSNINVTNEFVVAQGTSSFATVRQENGTVAVGGDFTVAYEQGAVGTYTLANGTLSSNKVKIGYIGNGNFVQSFGTQTVTTYTSIADQAVSNSTYAMRGGLLNTGELEVGYRGNGLMTHDGGTVNVGSFTAVGFVLSGRGEYNLLPGGTLNSPSTYVGLFGTGTFTQSGGLHSVPGILSIGENTGSDGTYVLGDTGRTVTGEFDVGFQGTGRAIQNGGTLTANEINVGASLGGIGTYTMNGGNIAVGDENISFMTSTSGKFVQNGGTHNITGVLNLAVQPATSAAFDLNGGNVSAASLNIGGGSLTAGGAAVFNQTGGVINVANRVRVYGGNSLNISGGSFSSGNLFTNSGGAVNLGAGGDLAPRVTGITGASGFIDVTDNALIVDYTGASPQGLPNSFGTIAGLIANGWANGNWTGLGIRSTLGTSGIFAVGYGEASSVLGGAGTFRGETVDATSVLVLFTYYGDANLTQRVNLDDFTILATNFGFGGKVWSDGDFNYDGFVNLDDFTLLAANFGRAFDGARSSVPEPTAASLLGLAAVAGLRRKRRR